MDDEMLSIAKADLTPAHNQISAIHQTPESRDGERCFGNLPAEIWLLIGDFLDSNSDKFRLSRVNKFLFSLLTFARAKIEAELNTTYSKRKLPSMLYVALKQGWPLDEIKKVVAGYAASNSTLLETHLCHCWQPPLHLAVGMNRIDVVDLLLKSGVRVNIKWCGNLGECPIPAHTECCGSKSCKNALDIARESKNYEMEQYLLLKGIDDLGRDEIPEWMGYYHSEAYTARNDWRPSF